MASLETTFFYINNGAQEKNCDADFIIFQVILNYVNARV